MNLHIHEFTAKSYVKSIPFDLRKFSFDSGEIRWKKRRGDMTTQGGYFIPMDIDDDPFPDR